MYICDAKYKRFYSACEYLGTLYIASYSRLACMFILKSTNAPTVTEFQFKDEGILLPGTVSRNTFFR